MSASDARAAERKRDLSRQTQAAPMMQSRVQSAHGTPEARNKHERACHTVSSFLSLKHLLSILSILSNKNQNSIIYYYSHSFAPVTIAFAFSFAFCGKTVQISVLSVYTESQ